MDYYPALLWQALSWNLLKDKMTSSHCTIISPILHLKDIGRFSIIHNPNKTKLREVETRAVTQVVWGSQNQNLALHFLNLTGIFTYVQCRILLLSVSDFPVEPPSFCRLLGPPPANSPTQSLSPAVL